MLKHITLIMPAADVYRSNKFFIQRPLSITLPVLYSLVPKNLGITCNVYDEYIEDIDYEKIETDLVCISAMTSTGHRAIEIATYFKTRGIPSVLGGMFASTNTREALECFDAVVIGQGFDSFPQLLNDFYQKGCLNKEYINFECKKLKYWNGPSYECYRDKPYFSMPYQVQATFGCNNFCSFCVQRIQNPLYLIRPINKIVDEIKKIPGSTFDFLDPNILCDKQFFFDLCNELIPLKKKWTVSITIDAAFDLSLLTIMQKAGCKSVLIGFETLYFDSLRKIGKQKNSQYDYSLAIKNLHRKGITVIGSFILGLDKDTYNQLSSLSWKIFKLGIDVPRFTILTPYGNTPLYAEFNKSKRIFDYDCTKYDAAHVVYKPELMSKDKLEKIYYKITKKNYNIFFLLVKLIFFKTFTFNDFFTCFLLKRFSLYTINDLNL